MSDKLLEYLEPLTIDGVEISVEIWECKRENERTHYHAKVNGEEYVENDDQHIVRYWDKEDFKEDLRHALLTGIRLVSQVPYY